MSEKNSELALKILNEYGLVERYTEEKCLYKIDRLRKYILEREYRDEMERRKNRPSKQTTFSLESD